MPTLDDTAGGASANSYASVAFADTYLDSRPDAADTWNDPATLADTKAACLIRATQRMESFSWRGEVVTTTQALAWPRTGTYNRNGVAYADDEVPAPIKQACVELALVMLGDSNWGGSDGLDRYNSITLGGVDTFNIRHGGRGGLPPSVTPLISHLILSTQARILRA